MSGSICSTVHNLPKYEFCLARACWWVWENTISRTSNLKMRTGFIISSAVNMLGFYVIGLAYENKTWRYAQNISFKVISALKGLLNFNISSILKTEYIPQISNNIIWKRYVQQLIKKEVSEHFNHDNYYSVCLH